MTPPCPTRRSSVIVELSPRDDAHVTLRDEVVFLRTLQAILRCGEMGRITPVVAEAVVDAEHAAQRARVGLDRALTGRTDEHLGARALGSERVVRVERAVGGVATGVQSVQIGRASCRDRVCQYV